MVLKELIDRSPLRILEKLTNGGVGKGNIGVFAARRGIGKTACLVHIATDKLFQNKRIIHISFSPHTSHIVTWYEEIFAELAKRYNLENAMNIHDEIVKNRIIMSFIQNEIHVSEIEKSVSRLIGSSSFEVDTIIVDGYEFTRSSPAEIEGFRKLARNIGVELWFSIPIDDVSSLGSIELPEVLRPYQNDLAVIISLEPRENFIHLKCVKDHDNTNIRDMHLKLDPELLLIAQENTK